MSDTQVIPVVHLSLSDALASGMSQRSVKMRIARPSADIANVRIPGVGYVPAVVAIRSTLEVLHLSLVPTVPSTYQWRAVISPYDEGLLRRLFGRCGGSLDGQQEVRYEASFNLHQAHREVSKLEPPQGTVIQVVFAFNKAGNPEIEWYGSSIELFQRQCQMAQQKNRLAIEKAWPFGWFIRWTGYGLVVVPPDPGQDLWFQKAVHPLSLTINSRFLPVLESLWRSVYCEGEIGEFLKKQGYELDRIGHTRIGTEALSSLISARRDRRSYMTQFGRLPKS